ncbi:MAG TPA: pitrilysin family protein [Polyangiaceae bacterium]|nr:pitrilysin family protein [Polyangiaceae bacterium]
MPKPSSRAPRRGHRAPERGVAHALASGGISFALALGAQAEPSAPATKPAATAKTPAPQSGTPVAKPDTSSKRSPATLALERFALTIQRRTLANGLRVVLAPEPSAPTVAVSVSYGVGSRHEPLGKSGFAHLFEHMMFQGSRHVQKGQHFSLISERGGTLNGTTNTDRTNYFEVLPSGELELALWLESDRMRWLDVSAQNFENQRAVVKEEFRMRIANAAYAPASIRLSELVFANYAPYANPTIGKMEDLDRAELAWVRDFYEHHYAPNAAVLTIAGNFDVDQALDLVDRYFAPIPARTVEPFALPAEPPKAVPAREKVEDTNAKTPGVYYAWLIPPSHTSEHYALELLAMLLGDGDSAKLYQELVRKRALALEARAYTRDFVGPDQFTVQLVAADHAELGSLEKALDAELDKVRKTPPTDAELERLKQRLRASFVFGLESTLSRAVELGEYELFWNDARNIARELEHYESVSAKDLTAAAQRYLTDERRVVVEIMPKARTTP